MIRYDCVCDPVGKQMSKLNVNFELFILRVEETA